MLGLACFMAASSKQLTSGFSADIHSVLVRSGEYSDSDEDSMISLNDADDNDNDNDDREGMTVDDDENDEDVDVDGDINRSVPPPGDGNWQAVKLKSKSQKRKQQTMQAEVQKKSRLTHNDKQSNEEKTVERDVKPVVYVRGQVTKLTSCNPFTISEGIERTFGAVSRVECRGTSLKVTCTSVHQKEQILRAKLLGNIDVITSIPNSERRKQQEAIQPRLQRVVIVGVPTDIDDNSITESTDAVQVRRITKRNPSGGIVSTTAVVLSYDCAVEDVPDRVEIGYLTFRTRVYIPLVTRCYKCQKYGHIAANCRRESHTCPICAGPHSYAECATKDTKKCANCGGGHSVSYRDCPKYVLAKQVTHRAATKHVSYRDALIQIKQGERANAAITETSISVVDADSEQRQHQTGEAQSKVGKQVIDHKSRDEINVIMVSTGVQCDIECQAAAPSDINLPIQQPVVKTNDGCINTDKGKHNVICDAISFSELYQLLAVVMQMSEDHSISRSTMIKAMMSYVCDKIDRPHEEIQQSIRQHYKRGSEDTCLKETKRTVSSTRNDKTKNTSQKKKNGTDHNSSPKESLAV